jgi:ADP-ribosylglycohydrolase
MPTPQHETRLERARCALEGLSVGDAYGQQLFLTSAPWAFTDDTNMALSIFSILRQHGQIDQDRLAQSFAHHYHPLRGYGPAMHGLLARIEQGVPWQQAARSLFHGTGSFGNGSAMRVAPVGGYFADDLDAAADNARCSAEVTHAHAEAAAGAIAVTIAAAIAWQAHESGERPSRPGFLDRILPHVPDSAVRDGIRQARELPPDTSVRQAVSVVGNGSRILCQDTVPFTLWCAGTYLDDYEEAIRLTVSGGGDVDTTCAIVGGIVALNTGIEGIPAGWRSSREPLPDWAFEDS